MTDKASDPHQEWTRQRQRDALIEQQAIKIKRLKEALRNIIVGNNGECGCAETALDALEDK